MPSPLCGLIGQSLRECLERMPLQEMNHAKTFADTEKLVIEVVGSSEISESIARAFHLAQAGTPGALVVDIRTGLNHIFPSGRLDEMGRT